MKEIKQIILEDAIQTAIESERKNILYKRACFVLIALDVLWIVRRMHH